MSEITLYKISNIEELKKKLTEKEFKKQNETKKVEIKENERTETYFMELYYNQNTDFQELNWANFARKFNFNPPEIQSRPRAIIIIEKDETYYGISFGTAYHYIDSYTDREWAFEFAKRVEYSKVNLIATSIPQSRLTKQTSSYRNYNETEINTGEALNKLKGYIELDNFNEITERVQAGNSLKFNLKHDNLETIAKTIFYVEKVIENEEVIHNLPYMTEIKDPQKINELNKILIDEFKKLYKGEESDYIDINNYVSYNNETREISDFYSFELISSEKNECYDDLTINILIHFIKTQKIKIKDILDINVILTSENDTITSKISQIIIFDCISENCVYEYGTWNEYNQDYINQLKAEISTIPAKYCPEFSFYTEKYKQYIDKRKKSNKEEDESFKNRNGYYNETTFNEYLHDCYEYEYYDKKLEKIQQKYKLEIMDLYKNKTAYYVKKGSRSEKLSYVVDQSIKGMNYIRKKEVEFDYEIKRVCIWIILDRKTEIHDENNDVDLNELETIIFKNRLVEWKKQMILWNYEPIIQINYKK